MPALSDVKTYATFIYAFLMLLYWTGTFVILYHLIRFGIGNQPKKIAIAFLAGSLLLSIITTLFFAQVIFIQ
jgi:hypothetical protein